MRKVSLPETNFCAVKIQACTCPVQKNHWLKGVVEMSQMFLWFQKVIKQLFLPPQKKKKQLEEAIRFVSAVCRTQALKLRENKKG